MGYIGREVIVGNYKLVCTHERDNVLVCRCSDKAVVSVAKSVFDYACPDTVEDLRNIEEAIGGIIPSRVLICGDTVLYVKEHNHLYVKLATQSGRIIGCCSTGFWQSAESIYDLDLIITDVLPKVGTRGSRQNLQSEWKTAVLDEGIYPFVIGINYVVYHSYGKRTYNVTDKATGNFVTRVRFKGRVCDADAVKALADSNLNCFTENYMRYTHRGHEFYIQSDKGYPILIADYDFNTEVEEMDASRKICKLVSDGKEADVIVKSIEGDIAVLSCMGIEIGTTKVEYADGKLGVATPIDRVGIADYDLEETLEDVADIVLNSLFVRKMPGFAVVPVEVQDNGLVWYNTIVEGEITRGECSVEKYIALYPERCSILFGQTYRTSLGEGVVVGYVKEMQKYCVNIGSDTKLLDRSKIYSRVS